MAWCFLRHFYCTVWLPFTCLCTFMLFGVGIMVKIRLHMPNELVILTLTVRVHVDLYYTSKPRSIGHLMGEPLEGDNPN